ncbi:MAG: helix-turn-helix transcriptional regulator [Thermotogota bacterium]|nr:helix-turn-helix transcriptional regulator [Thermotogota bacterium]
MILISISYFNGSKLRWIRENQNLTQKELAEMMGLDRSTISQYELGKRKPNNIAIVRQLAAILKSAPSDFYGDNVMTDVTHSIDLIRLLSNGTWEVLETVQSTRSMNCQLAAITDASTAGQWPQDTQVFIRYDMPVATEKFYLIETKRDKRRFIRKAVKVGEGYVFIPLDEDFPSFDEKDVIVIGRIMYSIKKE